MTRAKSQTPDAKRKRLRRAMTKVVKAYHKPWCTVHGGGLCSCASHRSDCDCASCDGERTR